MIHDGEPVYAYVSMNTLKYNSAMVVIPSISGALASSRAIKALPPKKRKKWEKINKNIVFWTMLVLLVFYLYWVMTGFK